MIIGNRNFDFSGREDLAYVMGILNVTPDSFSDGGRFIEPERALDHALKMQDEGADLLDIGAESTRPGSEPVTEDEEKKRLLPALKKIVPRLKIPVSVDTQKPSVADAALTEGASLINDVSALGTEGMAEVIVRHRAPVILMHKKGTPATMQKDPFYDDVLREVSDFLEARILFAAERGVDPEKILVDPGFGFGKRFEDNLNLLCLLAEFSHLRAPFVVGLSRKSFIRKIFGDDESALLAGSVAAAALAARSGASVIRVHDVAPTKAAIRLASGV